MKQSRKSIEYKKINHNNFLHSFLHQDKSATCKNALLEEIRKGKLKNRIRSSQKKINLFSLLHPLLN